MLQEAAVCTVGLDFWGEEEVGCVKIWLFCQNFLSMKWEK